MQRKQQAGWIAFGQFIGVIGAVVITNVVRGLVLAILWGWFIEPLGVRSINLAEAIGIAVIVGLLWQREPGEDDRTWGRWFLEAFVASVAGAILALAMGWIVHLFV